MDRYAAAVTGHHRRSDDTEEDPAPRTTEHGKLKDTKGTAAGGMSKRDRIIRLVLGLQGSSLAAAGLGYGLSRAGLLPTTRPLSPADSAAMKIPSSEKSNPLPDNTIGRMERILGVRKKINYTGSDRPLDSAVYRSPDGGGGVYTHSDNPAIVAHELGHASRGGVMFKNPVMGAVAYGVAPMAGQLLPFVGLAAPRAAKYLGYAGSALHIPQLYEEGRASVQGLRALNAATAKLPPDQRRSIMLRAAGALAGAGATYVANAAVPAVSGLIIDHYMNKRKAEKDEEPNKISAHWATEYMKTAASFRGVWNATRNAGRRLAAASPVTPNGLWGATKFVGKAVLGAGSVGLLAAKNPGITAGLGAAALGGLGYAGYKGIKGMQPKQEPVQAAPGNPIPRI